MGTADVWMRIEPNRGWGYWAHVRVSCGTETAVFERWAFTATGAQRRGDRAARRIQAKWDKANAVVP